MTQEKQKQTKSKENMGCLPTSAFLLNLLARHDNFNDALKRIRIETQKRASRSKYQTLLSLTTSYA